MPPSTEHTLAAKTELLPGKRPTQAPRASRTQTAPAAPLLHKTGHHPQAYKAVRATLHTWRSIYIARSRALPHARLHSSSPSSDYSRSRSREH